MTQINIRAIAAPETLALRQTVLWPHKSIHDVMLPEDETATHFGAIDGDDLVGVASFFPDGTKVRLRKLAIHPAYQGKGLGKELVMTAAIHLKAEGFSTLWCDARQSALGFYARLGFMLDPEVFEKSGLPYQLAELDLRHLP